MSSYRLTTAQYVNFVHNDHSLFPNRDEVWRIEPSLASVCTTLDAARGNETV